MKKISILGNPDFYIFNSWLMPVVFGVLLILDYITSKNVNLLIGFSLLSWSLFVLATRRGILGNNRISDYTPEIGDDNLVCKLKYSINWQLPLTKISHISQEAATGSIFTSNAGHFTIHTNDGDSYSIPITIPASQISEIQAAIFGN